jgi:septal ring factor EnvC (AmiA/AmiB activator)
LRIAVICLNKFVFLYAYSINAELTKFRHADAAKLKSTLEGVEKGHAIAMDGLNQQLRKSLAENATLERQLKDQENHGKKKDKEIADLRKAAADFEKRREGFNELLHYFQDNLLGTIPTYNVKFYPISAMPCVTHLLFPPCSCFGAGRGGYR